jgi:hypothetical protein
MIKNLFFLLLCFNPLWLNAQSFNAEKTYAINYIKRVFNSSPFEGAKKIEGDEGTYYAVSVGVTKFTADSLQFIANKALSKAQAHAEQGFSEPCIRFEIVGVMEQQSTGTSSLLFLCESLEQFLLTQLKKSPFDGARIVSAPNNKFIITSVSLENSKYATPEMRDKVAQMKAKQMVNTLVNGSTITSDMIIRVDQDGGSEDGDSVEKIREQAMGFINGLELLARRELASDKTTYLYYSRL